MTEVSDMYNIKLNIFRKIPYIRAYIKLHLQGVPQP